MKSSDLNDAQTMFAHRSTLLKTIERAHKPGYGCGFWIKKANEGHFFVNPIGHPEAFAAIVKAIEADIAGCTAELAKIGVTISDGEPSTYDQEFAAKAALERKAGAVTYVDELTGMMIAPPQAAE